MNSTKQFIKIKKKFNNNQSKRQRNDQMGGLGNQKLQKKNE